MTGNSDGRQESKLHGVWTYRFPWHFTLVTWLLIGCGSESSQSFAPLNQCTQNVECRRGSICIDGACKPISSVDEDQDGVPDIDERRLGTNPRKRDSDGDGISDKDELVFDEQTRQFNGVDSDDDGVIDARESKEEDKDMDGVPDAEDPCDDDPDCPTPRSPPAACLQDEGEPCVVGVGACRELGALACTDDLMGTECVGEPGIPTDELCDDKDNDCDGKTDESFTEQIGTACSDGLGVCFRDGVFACQDGLLACTFDSESIEGSEERCDGLDNDCDGMTDEGFPETDTPCSIGEGACEQAGIWVCDGDTLEALCFVEDQQTFVELCDGEDNDCDGETDEDFADLQAECSAGLGPCLVMGMLTCSPDGSDTQCSAVALMGSEDICNGVDDDCDGQVDEAFQGLDSPCRLGEGNCAQDGVLVCTEDGTGTECNAQAGDGGPERCDGIDNDCDSRTDEGFFLGSQCTVGLGLCQQPGQLVCDRMTGGTQCDGFELPPSIELCDGLDNDCDGREDEDFIEDGLGQPCQIQRGQCRAEGVQICDPGLRALLCSTEGIDASREICNERDDDCDGRVDEGFNLGAACVRGSGNCRTEGTNVCAPDGTLVCDAFIPMGEPEKCDGIDNDCDLAIDELFPGKGEECAVGVNECRSVGEQICSEDETELVCDAIANEVEDEICDGLDNDCDEKFDEEFPKLGQVCEVGKGPCRRVGTYICTDDQTAVECSKAPKEPGIEICNRFDDDCDESTDEDFPDLDDACFAGVGACRRDGTIVCTDDRTGTECSARAGIAIRFEACDALDDDCDGQADEDFGAQCTFLAQSVSAGNYETCALTGKSVIRCWGDSESPAPVGGFTRLSGGDDFHCGLNTTGALACWGRVNVNDPGPYRALAAGMSSHVCAIDTRDDLVRCFGTADQRAREAPQIPMATVSAGHNFTCGLRLDNGHATCWGRDINDVLSAPPGVTFTKLDSGYEHSCAIRTADGGITCWGLNFYNQLNAPDGQYTHVSVGTNTACAIKTDNTLACWGRGSANEANEFGQAVAPEGTFTDVTVGGHHACAIHTDGYVVCWGAGSSNYPNDGLRHVDQAITPR